MKAARAFAQSQRSQALIEFALVSPVLLLMLFGIVDIGRAIFYLDTLNHAAREGARVAARASTQLPTNSDVLATVTSQMIGTPVAEPCPQGPVTGATPPDN
ncbi:MAG TPA: TadE family protein, partial [Candidatus Dormibacteraeota bacterium]|nr:TadE family protein [Candidatus Dormibacteraeota bacterium]